MAPGIKALIRCKGLCVRIEFRCIQANRLNIPRGLPLFFGLPASRVVSAFCPVTITIRDLWKNDLFILLLLLGEGGTAGKGWDDCNPLQWVSVFLAGET